MDERTGSFKPIKKKRGEFNVIDLLIIFFIVGVVVVFAVSHLLLSDDGGKEITIEYTVVLEDVDKAFVDKVKSGNSVFDALSGASLGTVSAVDSSTPYFFYEYNSEEGAIVTKEFPDRYNVRITVSANAEEIEGIGYTVDDRRVAVGAKMDLRFPQYTDTGYCVEMRKVR